MTNKKNILIHISGPFTTLWLSISEILSSDYNVTISCVDYSCKKIIRDIIPDLNALVEVEKDFYMKNEKLQLDIMKEAILRERKYGEAFSSLISMDRALGRGYLFNADKYPVQGKAWWSNEKKINKLLVEFIYWEYIIDKYSPVLILSNLHTKILSLVSRHHKIRFLSLIKARFGPKYMWIENEYNQNAGFIEKVKEYVNEFSNMEKGFHVEYILDQSSLWEFTKFHSDFKTSLKKSARLFIYDSYRFIRQSYNKDKYKPWAWIPIIIRSYFRYRYFLKYGKKPEALKGHKIVYFALHQEPEITLQDFSPEFHNSMEIIAWVSKSLNADTLLVVREHPFSYGIRSKKFHDNLRSMGNVVLAHPEISSWEWIKRSSLVVSITGTAGVEAVYFGKPVITFGKHQSIRHLPTVRYVNNYDSTKEATNELLSLPENDRLFETSKKAFYHAQMDVSFEMIDYASITRNKKDLQPGFAKIIVDDLKKRYNF